MKGFLFIFVFVGYYSSAQTGFFLALDKTVPCTKSLVSLDEQQKYCITDEPIIKSSEFKVEGKIQDDLTQKNQYFNIRFTKSGFETLKLICEHLPEKQLLLVVNGKVAGTYQSKNLRPMSVMPISGTANSQEIKWLYENLSHSH
jgi:hypothetical protein